MREIECQPDRIIEYGGMEAGKTRDSTSVDYAILNHRNLFSIAVFRMGENKETKFQRFLDRAN